MAGEVVVDFDAAIQTLSALNAAAYRLTSVATCQIEKANGRYLCRLVATGSQEPEMLKARYLHLVTDENVREALREQTEPVRNVILSLAFGALAQANGK